MFGRHRGKGSAPSAPPSAYPPLEPKIQHLATSLKYLQKHQHVHLDNQDISSLGIRCIALEFTTGKAAGDGQQFLRMHPWKSVVAIAQQHRLRQYPQISRLDDAAYLSWHGARFMSIFFESLLLLSNPEGEESSSGLVLGPHAQNPAQGTIWRMLDSGGGMKNLHRSSDTHQFDIMFLLEALDVSKPHVTAFLANQDALENNALLWGEVWCLLMIMLNRLAKPQYSHHHVIPVTIVSVSGRKLRVVQAYVDGARGITHVQRTPIINFDRGTDACWGETLTVLSWFLGEPVGKTT
ncbi:Uu.00g012930.m01.CDS01 [Anthostomella pinea]|uniref:Uu.00g012930.m01.CDS01 n=1 Tax=Anthostomella pinea TaxID=933095 RepID=A0AAI8YQ48_9PEZI|nr:Uu.00g012930.m01.CDS01 [Anthostomella pinea]